ncbi:MAG TPA: EthD family reductase [Vicinamibacterales bacterium]|nr:EthD family reductase [Vicinamibacterales bacterium]
MIKVSVLYPNGPGAKFDMKYYLSSHMPMVKQTIGAAVKGMAVEEGLGLMEPGSPPMYLAMGHLFFESIESFQLAFSTHGGPIVADVPNYTNTQPIIQVNEVRL